MQQTIGTKSTPTKLIKLQLGGLKCGQCTQTVRTALSAVSGVTDVEIDQSAGIGCVTAGPTVPPQELVSAVEAAGFEALILDDVTQNGHVDLQIEGMSCASCASRVQKALEAVPGVNTASVNMLTHRARVTGTADPVLLSDAVSRAGYRVADLPIGSAHRHTEHGAATIAPSGNHQPSIGAHHDSSGPAHAGHDHARVMPGEQEALARAASVAAFLSAPIVVLEMGSHLIPAFHDWIHATISMQGSRWIQAILATAVLFGPGLRFYRAGLPALWRGAPEMNALVAVGTLAAWSYSMIALLFPQALPAGSANIYFEAAAVIVTLVLLGRWLEALAKRRTSLAIRRLIGLQPRTARVRRGSGVEEVAITALQSGDLVEVRPGERVAADGVVVDGSSYVDESMITGEPIPNEKVIGSIVTGGTINQTGALVIQATSVGDASVLSQIVRMVEDAQAAKLPIQAMVDRVTGWFVPGVLALAAMTLAIWLAFGPAEARAFAVINAVAVLIIACPCAMGLATPTSVMVATGRAAELGVLFARGDALQTLQGVKAVALDKTGTITEGRPVLSDFHVATGFDRDHVLRLVASAEARSEHPVARAVVAAVPEGPMPDLTDFRSITGGGVEAVVAGVAVLIGNSRLMSERGVALAGLEVAAAALRQAGKGDIHVALDGVQAAVFAVSDPVKPTSAAAIAALHELGLKVAMISGDAIGPAQAVARAVGIDHVIADVAPAGKVDAINALKRQFGATAFVGDGVNDAPALAAADVGLAVGTGTDVAIDTADVVLMSGSLKGLVTAIVVSRHALANIRQNLFWAFGYNAALIPVAAGILWPFGGPLLSPILAAAAMAASSLCVVANALRLQFIQAPKFATSSGTHP